MGDFSEIKATLEAQLEELMARAADIEKRLSSPGSKDWEEHAVEAEDNEVLERVGQATKTEIREIRLALNLIEAGTYGKCTRCGGEIAPERLEEMPYATVCIRCA